MELMSSLLLCALATLVPQALGKNDVISGHNTSGNVSAVMKNTSVLNNGHVLQTASSNKVRDPQSVFLDSKCRTCIACMERALKSHVTHNKLKTEKFHDELLIGKRNIRDKRKSNDSAHGKLDKKTKKNKSNDSVQGKLDKKTKKNKSKNNKSISVTKYNEKERIYALKVMESNIQGPSVPRDKNTTMTCQIYSVKESFPCESPEADLILKESKKKINRKSKKDNKREKNVKTKVIAPIFRKRQIDQSQTPEQIMSSVEEFD